MSKFNVGDIIVGTPESNEVYGETRECEGFVGKVLELHGLDGYDYIKVQIIDSFHPNWIGHVWNVRASLFELSNEDATYVFKPFTEDELNGLLCMC